ncbi:hypothetical protein RF683_06940 [Flavobacterium sp. 20NA77.7]|uniref:tRNA_anti-like n=1 Tax=Flavobacterium nakdongensis TaxID=3073563 RepID=A0ABY9R987_9FLAO|nr:hypothetical protein [Flavobacterium sp. 20NA77.7]WMW77229.1 hypothetical protein RF683_06940 [Flavobacterium sp. 20NA77.7]
MTNKTKLIIVFIALSVVLGYFSFNYIMYGGARDIQKEESAYNVSSKAIIEEFSKNTNAATKKYIDKSIEIKGVITSVNDSLVSIDESVICKMKEISKSSSTVGKSVSVKGRIIGFDDLMEEIKLDECVIN